MFTIKIIYIPPLFPKSHFVHEQLINIYIINRNTREFISDSGKKPCWSLLFNKKIKLPATLSNNRLQRKYFSINFEEMF